MTGQNTSGAVMQQRDRTRSSLDYYPTPPWVARALCMTLENRSLKMHAGLGDDVTCWEPAFGSGDLARGLAPYFDGMLCSDIHMHDRIAEGQRPPVIGDFLIDALWQEEDGPTGADWIITNPPFALGPEFVTTALKRARVGVAMFVRTSFLEGQARLNHLYRPHPPALILQFSERVPLFEGKLRRSGSKYWDPTMRDGAGGWRAASSAATYCWIVWLHGESGTAFDWIAPCRKTFEVEGDYPPADLPPETPADEMLDFAADSAAAPAAGSDAP